MKGHANQQYLLNSQYKDSDALNARIQIYRFSVNKQGWWNWYFEHIELPQQCRILELGCGNGNFWKSNTHRIPEGWRVTLTDFSPGMLEEAKCSLADVEHRFEYRIVDAQAIPYDDCSFDAVIANHMLYHIPERARALAEIRRVLRPGGKLHASTLGIGAMRELQEICNRLDPRIDLNLDSVAQAFGLDNGAEQLGEFFDNVQRHLYEDYLLVPDAGPIVDYIMSTSDSVPLLREYGAEVLTRVVEEALERERPLRITKRGGIFVGW